MKNFAVGIFAVLLVFALAWAAFIWERAGTESSARWYDAAQATAGAEVFAKNCLVCHGMQGQGAANWQTRLSDGSFPPPPLNGGAHTWHHSLAALKRTIKNGGAQYGGNMPAFQGVLSDEEIEQVIAYFQSQWPDEIYQVWEEKVNKRD